MSCGLVPLCLAQPAAALIGRFVHSPFWGNLRFANVRRVDLDKGTEEGNDICQFNVSKSSPIDALPVVVSNKKNHTLLS
ncbi:unnamed protein product [Gadus morhua 'NCC']